MGYEFKMDWYVGDSIRKEHKSLFVAQASCWIVTTDQKFILVSKDGKSWTVPAGHTEKSDGGYVKTAIREVKEETGLDISLQEQNIKVLGYYVISAYDKLSGLLANKDIQIRLFLQYRQHSAELKLQPMERNSQVVKVRYSAPFSLSETVQKIPWFGKSGDLKEIKKLIEFSE